MERRARRSSLCVHTTLHHWIGLSKLRAPPVVTGSEQCEASPQHFHLLYAWQNSAIPPRWRYPAGLLQPAIPSSFSSDGRRATHRPEISGARKTNGYSRI